MLVVVSALVFLFACYACTSSVSVWLTLLLPREGCACVLCFNTVGAWLSLLLLYDPCINKVVHRGDKRPKRSVWVLIVELILPFTRYVHMNSTL